ncbi:MAG: 50S ribosomal protein L9 [Candidatus Dormibacteraceae bacterium]
MKVLLTKQVENVGSVGDIKEVKAGFGRNFLIPRQLAVRAHRGMAAAAEQIRQAAARREAQDRQAALELAHSIADKTVICQLKVGVGDKVFGAITNDDIATALFAQHEVELDKRSIDLRDPIKQLGEHQVTLRLHREVPAQVNVIVTAAR